MHGLSSDTVTRKRSDQAWPAHTVTSASGGKAAAMCCGVTWSQKMHVTRKCMRPEATCTSASRSGSDDARI